MSDADKALLLHALILASVAVLGLFTAYVNAKIGKIKDSVESIDGKVATHDDQIKDLQRKPPT